METTEMDLEVNSWETSSNRSLSLSTWMEDSQTSAMDTSVINDESLNEFQDITQILKACKPDLSRFLNRFKEAFVINSSIAFLTEAAVAEIFDKEIGLRPIFLASLHEFRNHEETVDSNEAVKIKKPSSYIFFSQWKPCVSILKTKWRH